MPCRRGGCQMIIGVLWLQAMHWLGTLLELILFVNAESLSQERYSESSRSNKGRSHYIVTDVRPWKQRVGADIPHD